MSFCFQNVFFFSNCAFIFKIRKVLLSFDFPFSEKHNCKQKSVHSLQIAFTNEVVNKHQNIYKAFKFVSVVKNLSFIINNFL